MLALIVAAVLPALIAGYPPIQCPGNLPPPVAIRIDGCESSPCYVYQGEIWEGVTFEVDFINTAATDQLTLSINSTVFGVTFPVNILPPWNDGCFGLINAFCPVAAGQALTHSASLPVPTDLHDGITATLTVQLTNHLDLTVVCAVVNLVIY